jgi:polyisoprenoid-binding protein YceI
MKKLFTAVLVFIAVFAFAFLYLTRPVDAPSQDTQANAERLEEGGAGDSRALYRLAEGSSVSFTVGEILNGSPFTVVGKTSDVAGDILLDTQDGAKTTVGKISVNARTIKTDNSRRDGAISRLILRSDDAANEFITFEPSTVTGLPEKIEAGKDMDVTITGMLSISGVTKEAVFTGTVRLMDADTLTGAASATVQYKDFGLTVPQVSFVAGVDEQVILDIHFTAKRVNS